MTPVAFMVRMVSSRSPHGPRGPWRGDNTKVAGQVAEQATQDLAHHGTRAYSLLSIELRCTEKQPREPHIALSPG